MQSWCKVTKKICEICKKNRLLLWTEGKFKLIASSRMATYYHPIPEDMGIRAVHSITCGMQRYCIPHDIFLLECSRQKRQEEHRHAEGREEQHGHTHEGDGCKRICDCFLHIANLLEILMFIILSQHRWSITDAITKNFPAPARSQPL